MKHATHPSAVIGDDKNSAGPPTPRPMAPYYCDACGGAGRNEEHPVQVCSRYEGTRTYKGVADAWDRLGVTAVYVDIDRLDLGDEPRQLVRLETFDTDTALTVDGAEKLASRLYGVVFRLRGEAKQRDFAAALANGERPLESVREQLGARAYNCLGREGILTIERAAAMSDGELLAIMHLGLGTLERIRSVVGRVRSPLPPEAEA